MEKNKRDGIENVLDKVLSRHPGVSSPTKKIIISNSKSSKNFPVGESLWNSVHQNAKNDINSLFQQVNDEIDSILQFARDNAPTDFLNESAVKNSKDTSNVKESTAEQSELTDQLTFDNSHQFEGMVTEPLPEDGASLGIANPEINKTEIDELLRGEFTPSSVPDDLSEESEAMEGQDNLYSVNEISIDPHQQKLKDNKSKRAKPEFEDLFLDEQGETKVEHGSFGDDFYRNHDSSKEKAMIDYLDILELDDLKNEKNDAYSEDEVEENPFANYEGNPFSNTSKEEYVYDEKSVAGQLTRVINMSKKKQFNKNSNNKKANFSKKPQFGGGQHNFVKPAPLNKNKKQGPLLEDALNNDQDTPFNVESNVNLDNFANEAKPEATVDEETTTQQDINVEPEVTADKANDNTEETKESAVEPAPVDNDKANETDVKAEPASSEEPKTSVEENSANEDTTTQQDIKTDEDTTTQQDIKTDEDTTTQQDIKADDEVEQTLGEDVKAEVKSVPVDEHVVKPSAKHKDKPTFKKHQPKQEAEEEQPYYMQFVGNFDYGYYDEQGNWVWAGYFDDNNKWIPTVEEEPKEKFDASDIDDLFAFNEEEEIEEELKKKK